ncbi:MAG: tRNA (adenosine(37)-N6)-threonylcarbamoyltransferase complex dimerization subunit type 1 TsaB [Chloroflexota bacterium]|nr:tRNA (adenosine(37)-N6)-threonylcarbamoyltransferase complex dimerization subunit type 1 TsaB [Chloroflexota bacterium]MDE2909678.1 tRNA (adenosine(37)-N6)-threonylcarbamoyltransferase complex dimerization subunit type 1 TsaB [Chloroflexota bacterium]
MLLAIDTATEILSIALHDGESLAAECTLRAGRQHSALLAPLIGRTLAQSGLSADDLEQLAVSVGPGSYTGTRIGVALAKGMAAPRDLPLIPATTLETAIAAQPLQPDDTPLIATVFAGRNRVIWAEYRCEGDVWIERRAPQISEWQALLANYKRPIRLCGEISAAGLQVIRQARDAGARIELAPASQRIRRAGCLAEIAWRRLRARDADAFPADRVMPVYLQDP